MSDVTGPINTLPGAIRNPPPGATCDNHPEMQAVVRIQGETDSMGSEQHDLCYECASAIRKDLEKDRSGVCEWCHSEANDLQPRRDFEEGLCGRVYRVCGGCVRREREALEAEIAESGADDCSDEDFYD